MQMPKIMRKAIHIIGFFAFGFFIIGLVYNKQNKAYQAECQLKGMAGDCSLLHKIFEDFSNANYMWLVIPVILFMISNWFRALRWKMLLNALGYYPKMYNLFGTVMINYLTNLGIPRSGEIIRGGLISKYENIPVEKALGTIVTDRVFDVIMLLITFCIALVVGGNRFIQYLNSNMDLTPLLAKIMGNTWLIVFLILGLIGLGLYFHFYKEFIRKSRLVKKLNDVVHGFWQGVKSVKYVSSIPLFVFYTVGIWGLYYLMLYVGFFAFEPTSHLGWDAGLLVFVFGSLGIVIPTPGGMGSYHFLVGEALAMYGISGADGFSFANLIYFSLTIFATLLFGSISALALPILNKDT